MRSPRTILTYGPDALLLQWEQRIAPDISAGVHAWAAAISGNVAVRECVPAYASLLVRFAPRLISAYDLQEFILALKPESKKNDQHLHHQLPVCYDGPDLQEVASLLGLSPERVIQLHTSQKYLVYQIGFRPGFGFLGQTLTELEVARRSAPRARVPAGSVGIAGRQTGIYPSESPGGWQLIGRCPVPLLRAGDQPALLRAGDTVQFRPVSLPEFNDLLNSPAPWPKR
ncbi:5-oxoprolinase subunit PxpB [Neolewinella aurantiaca]|uniref:5-oxoprolinase subunit PxpB n=1 Tax=Neolewinella aurantiaca TaxID=2602767 RepID=UPI001650C808|nr:5-oxoprolinase subunit PxpB [Neolewinella aurantiaca]